MQFKAIVVLAAAQVALAAPSPAPEIKGELNTVNGFVARRAEAHGNVEKREVVTAVVTSVATAVITDIATKAINKAGELIAALSNWDQAREEFTKSTAKAMWDANPDPAKYPAAICYNMAYKFKRADGFSGAVKANLKSSNLHTDYDCFYMEGNNDFYSEGDGGYINLAMWSDSNRCTFDKSTSDLICKA